MMLVIGIRSQYVRRCGPNFTRDRSLTLKLKDSQLERAEHKISRKWLCPTILPECKIECFCTGS